MNSKTVINNISKFWPGSTKCVRQSVLSNEHEKCVPVAAGGGGGGGGGGWVFRRGGGGVQRVSKLVLRRSQLDLKISVDRENFSIKN